MTRTSLRTPARKLLSLFPPGAAPFIYTKLLKPKALRTLANRILLSMLPEMVSLPEGKLWLNQNDPVISGALALEVYENFELEIFRNFLTEGMTVLDIGANIGLYSVIAAGRIGAAGKVIACEPEPISFSLLTRNVAANNFSNITLFPCALADQDGNLDLYVSAANQGNHSLIGENRKKDRTITVPVRTGDSLLHEMGNPPVSIIKIDVEGAEPLVFKGLRDTLRNAETLAMFFEFSPDVMRNAGFAPGQFLESLAANSFNLYEIRENAKKIIRIENAQDFARQRGSGSYTNILALKNLSLPEKLEKYEN